MTLSLRDALLAALTQLPGTREFHLHVLISSPQKNASLFRFAIPRPRTYLQQVLVLLSEQTTPDSPRILVTAIEASVYNIPSTSCAILYISKVDSSGHATAPSPTYVLIKSLLTYYANPTTRPITAETLWIHLFARAQGQYLFPNSVEYEGKRPLSDIKLCAWWKRVFTDVAHVLEEEGTPASSKVKPQTNLYYILPGYTEFEAAHALKNVSSTTSTTSTTGSATGQWFYGHPYLQTEIILPCPPDHALEGKTKNLGHFIPSFDDDPKSRFIDEIAYITDGEIKSPKRKRSRTLSHNEGSHSNENNDDGTEEKKEKEKDEDYRPLGELGKVTPDDFWERMSFRQECVAGAVTGFFMMGISPSVGDGGGNVTASAAAISPLAPQPGQVSSQLNKRILTTLTTSVEFSTRERAIRGTEIIENAIRGLCEGIAPIPTTMGRAVRTFPKIREIDRRTPERETLIQPSTPTSTSPSYSLLAPPSTPPRRFGSSARVVADMVSPNPFPEPIASLETYHSHIYGTIKVMNVVAVPVGTKAGSAAAGEKEECTPQITVLTARKKKKRAE